MDQELSRRNFDPLFKENYYAYDKDEFLVDADFEFVKIKNLLSKSPKALSDDPILQIDYMKIINLIKKKKLLERTTDAYDPESTLQNDYYDIQEEIEKNQANFAKQLAQIAMAQEDVEVEASKGAQESFDAQVETQVKSDKKTHAKEQLKIMKQFDQMAEKFTKTTTKVEQLPQKETAGQVRKANREKQKKEKTLGAKLRLKAKKNK